jgi:hypothetical protein
MRAALFQLALAERVGRLDVVQLQFRASAIDQPAIPRPLCARVAGEVDHE